MSSYVTTIIIFVFNPHTRLRSFCQRNILTETKWHFQILTKILNKDVVFNNYDFIAVMI